jgi:hypothetical protein
MFVFAAVFAFGVDVLQAADAARAAQMIASSVLIDIYKTPQFKNSCAGLNVASLGDSDGFQTGTGRCQTEFGRFSNCHRLTVAKTGL